jgi:hypothetical protein
MNERMNIRRMQNVEKSEALEGFDPMRELTTNDWADIRQVLRHAPNNVGEQGHGRLAAAILNIRPDEKEEFISSSSKHALHRYVLSHANFNGWEDVASIAALSRPNAGMLFKPLPEDMQTLEQRFQQEENRNDWYVAAKLAVLLKIFDPNSTVTDLDIHRLVDFIHITKREKEWYDAAYFAASLKVLQPEALQLSKEDWQKMLADFQRMRAEKNWWEVLPYARFLELIAAERVEIKDLGLDAIPKKMHQLEEKPSRLPTASEINI